jgi:hypothetical protein
MCRPEQSPKPKNKPETNRTQRGERDHPAKLLTAMRYSATLIFFFFAGGGLGFELGASLFEPHLQSILLWLFWR